MLFKLSPGRRLARFRPTAAFALLLALGLAGSVRAQDRTILFSVSDPGTTAAITNWGLDTCWPSFDNLQRGLIFMGTNNVNIVRVGFFVDAPLTNNDVTPADKSAMQTDLNLAGMATAATRWDLNLDSSVNAWYQSGANTVYPDRWAAAMEACQRYYNRSFWAAEGFNEPDYSPNGEGSPQNLHDIFGYLQASTNFSGAAMEGGSTLNDDGALSWFDPIAARASIGSTHCLAGSAASYVNFIQSVTASNAMPFNPEMHNVMEAILGVNYGLQGGIWWGTAELARGSFVKACQGRRLGYADDLNNWTAAAVYRAPGGAVQAFVGASERMATTTSYRFFSSDRDVFYDGYGPQRDYTVTIPGGTGYQVNQPNAEKLVNIAWGADVQPAISGRYLIVNRNSGLVLEVPGGSTANGVQLDQSTYTGRLYQQWDVTPMSSTSGGDYSYFTMAAAHDGVTADLSNFSYANGDQVQQWNGGTNVVEQWYFQYTTNGYFKIRSRWSNKVVSVSGASKSSGAPMVQWDDTGTPAQQWRLIPATVSTYDFVAPAAPTGVAATAQAVSIQLNWKTNSEADLASYTVLRSATNGGPYDIVARGLTNTVFTDKSANQPETYYYVVQAADQSLNASTNSAQVSATPVLTPVLVARYTFDGSARDNSGNANDAELVGSPGYVPGQFGQALSLSGTSQYAMAPAGIMASATNFTIAAWVYWNGGPAWQRIFDFGNGTAQYLFLTPGSGSGTLRFAITTNGAAAEQQLNASSLSTNQWIHVAVTCDGATASLYTNGVLAASGGVSLSPAAFNPALNNFGASQFPADPFFNGSLDDVRIYNYALNAAQVAQLMAPATSVWGGSGADNNWSDGMNWENDIAPATSGDAVVFAGSTRTAPNLDNNYSVVSLTFSNNAGRFTIGTADGSTLALAGGLTNNSTSVQTLNVPVLMNGVQTFNAAAGNLALGSTVNNSGSLLTVAGANNTTIGGALSVNGGLSVTGSGMLTLAGASNAVGGALLVTAGAINITGGSTTLGSSSPASIGYETGSGAMSWSSGGTLTALGNVWVGGSDQNGPAYHATGTLNISGGTANFGGSIAYGGPHFADGSLAIGAGNNYQNSCSGTMTVSGGTVWVTNDLIVGFAGMGTGVLNISGSGAVNVGAGGARWLSVGKWDTVNGLVNVSGGNLNLLNNSAIVFSSGNAGNNGGGGTNVITQSGGAVTFYSDGGATVGGSGSLDLTFSGSTAANNTYNLNGGILIVPQIISANTNGTRTFNFNGGTLKAAAASAAYFASGAADTANVRNGGAVIDDGGHAVTISQPLVHSAMAGDNAVDGGLTKLGSGTLTLNGTNTYTGNTSINAGTLILNQATLAADSSVIIAGGAKLQLGFTATNRVRALVLNGVPQPPGVYNGSTAPNFFAGTGSLLVPIATNPTNVAYAVTGGVMVLSWPTDHTGWQLQVQTNTAAAGLGTNWMDVSGANLTNTVTLPIDAAVGSVFYRLVYP